MKVLIVYDSFFGNTENLAQAMKKALQKDSRVDSAEAVHVDKADPKNLGELDLLIVGSPTRAFRPTPEITRFLKTMPSMALKGKKTAAFDTGISPEDANPRFLRLVIRIFGYAAQPISAGLRKKGGTLIMPPTGFLVADTEGPLKSGELERAAEWAGECIESIL